MREEGGLTAAVVVVVSAEEDVVFPSAPNCNTGCPAGHGVKVLVAADVVLRLGLKGVK